MSLDSSMLSVNHPYATTPTSPRSPCSPSGSQCPSMSRQCRCRRCSLLPLEECEPKEVSALFKFLRKSKVIRNSNLTSLLVKFLKVLLYLQCSNILKIYFNHYFAKQMYKNKWTKRTCYYFCRVIFSMNRITSAIIYMSEKRFWDIICKSPFHYKSAQKLLQLFSESHHFHHFNPLKALSKSSTKVSSH